MNKYLISICIPTYNRQEEVYELVKEILSIYNNSKYIEICVSDNNSSDNTLLKLNEFVNFTNFKLNVNKENVYFDNNLLKAATIANGEYLFFLGDDDRINFEFFDDITKIIELNNPKIDAIFCNYIIRNIKTNKTRKMYNLYFNQYNKNINDILELGHGITFMSSIIIKRAMVNFDYMKKYIGSNFIHVAMVLSSLERSNNILFYANPLVCAFDNGLSDYDLEQYFDVCLYNLIENNFSNLNKVSLDKFNKSIFDLLCPILLFKRKNTICYYINRYSNKKVYLLLLPSSFYSVARKIKRIFVKHTVLLWL